MSLTDAKAAILAKARSYGWSTDQDEVTGEYTDARTRKYYRAESHRVIAEFDAKRSGRIAVGRPSAARLQRLPYWAQDYIMELEQLLSKKRA